MSLAKSRSNSRFISVLTVPTTNGSLSFDLATVDALSNLTTTIVVTPVLSGTAVEDVATQIYTACTAQLSDSEYSGLPVYSEDQPNSTFRADATGHIASLWSQSIFQLKLTANDTGSYIAVSETPNFVTIQQALDYAAIKGFNFKTVDGTDFTIAQIIQALAPYSALVVNKLGNFVIPQTYLNQFRGKDNKSVFLKPKPIIYRDTVRAKIKAWNTIYGFPGYASASFNCIASTGELNYIPDSTLVNMGSPYRMDNEVQVTFVAGTPIIPEELVKAILDLYYFDVQGLSNVKSLAGDSFKVELNDPEKILRRIYASIRLFKG